MAWERTVLLFGDAKPERSRGKATNMTSSSEKETPNSSPCPDDQESRNRGRGGRSVPFQSLRMQDGLNSWNI